MAPLQGEQQQGSSRNLHLIPLHVDPPPSLSGTQLPTSTLISRPLPLSLGRKQLASWWWTTCPCLGVVTRHPCRRSCRRLSRHVHSLSKEAMMVISERGRLSVSGKNAMRLIKVNGKALPSPTQQPDLQLVAQDIISVGIDSPVRTDHVTEEKVDNPSRTSMDDQEDNEDCRPWMRFQLLDATTTGQPIVTPELPSRFAKHSNSWLTTMTNHSRPQHAKRHSQRRLFPSVFRSTKQNELIDSLEDISSDSEGMCSNRQELPALQCPSDSIESEEIEEGCTNNLDRKMRRDSRRFKKDSPQSNPKEVDAGKGDESLQQAATISNGRDESPLSSQPCTKRLRNGNPVIADRVEKQMPVVTPCKLQPKPRKHRDSIVSSQSSTLLEHPLSMSASDQRKRRKLLQQQSETTEDVSHGNHSSKSIACHNQMTSPRPLARRRLLFAHSERGRHSSSLPCSINGKDGADHTGNSQPSPSTGRKEATITHTASCNRESSQVPSNTQADAIPFVKRESAAAPSATQHVPSDQIVEQKLSKRIRKNRKVQSLTTDESQCQHVELIDDRHSLSQSTGELIPTGIMAVNAQSQAKSTRNSARRSIDLSSNEGVDSLPTIKNENLRKRCRDLLKDETVETECPTSALDKSNQQFKFMLGRRSLSQSTGDLLISTDMPVGSVSRKINVKARRNCSAFRRLDVKEDDLTSNSSSSDGAPSPNDHHDATTLQNNPQGIYKETATTVGDLRQKKSQKADTPCVEYSTMLSLPQCPSSATEADSEYRSEQSDPASPPLANHNNVESDHRWESLQRHKRDNDTKGTLSISTVTLSQWRRLATAQNNEIPTHVQALARLIAAKNSNVECAERLWLPPLLNGTMIHGKFCGELR